MDRSEAKRFRRMGFMGIIKEALYITFSQRKSIFSKIAIALILPCCLLTIADTQLKNYSVPLESTNQFGSEGKQHQLYSNKWITFGVFYTTDFLLVLALLFPVPIISYAVACAYASKDPNLTQLMQTTFLSNVWKRLSIIYMWNFLIKLVCDHFVFRQLLLLSIVLEDNPKFKNIGITIFSVIMLLSLLGYVYMSMIWDLASVVLVLEDLSGLRALKRSNDLLKGKRWVGCVLFVGFYVCSSGLHIGGIGEVVTVKGLGCFLGLLLLNLMRPVVQTVLYFVCKCLHRESVDKVSLRDQLDGCFGRCGRIGV